VSKNYAEIADKISKPIGLTKHLVAVKLFDDLSKIPEGCQGQKASCTIAPL